MDAGDGDMSRPQLDHEEDQVAFQPLERENLDREQIGRGQTVPMRLEERFPRCALASLWRRAMPWLRRIRFTVFRPISWPRLANAPRIRV